MRALNSRRLLNARRAQLESDVDGIQARRRHLAVSEHVSTCTDPYAAAQHGQAGSLDLDSATDGAGALLDRAYAIAGDLQLHAAELIQLDSSRCESVLACRGRR